MMFCITRVPGPLPRAIVPNPQALAKADSPVIYEVTGPAPDDQV